MPSFMPFRRDTRRRLDFGLRSTFARPRTAHWPRRQKAELPSQKSFWIFSELFLFLLHSEEVSILRRVYLGSPAIRLSASPSTLIVSHSFITLAPSDS